MENVSIIVLLLFGITFLAILSNKYKFPFPIALVLAGLLISLIPNLPPIMLKPEVVFLIFLPPLLYAAAWNTSWHDFKANLRPISLAAFGLVFFTTGLVGWIAHEFIPELTWAEAFLLGAIISPPDAVAATSVTKGLGLHPRIITILEGESLMNDASGLIAYKYALAAILTGAFSLSEASWQFVLVVGAGIVVGLIVGGLMYLVHKYFVCDANIEVALTIITPFASYLLAESFHVSGVLAVVSTGLFLSYSSGDIFSHQSRIQAYAFWDVIIFVLNGLVFILIGLQLSIIIKDDTDLLLWILYGVGLSIFIFVIRLIWVIPSSAIPRLLSAKIRQREYYSRKYWFVFTWAGMRGVVSMAAALALPLTMPDGSAFQNRDLIVFLTFCVIIFSLVFQGLSLPWLIKVLKLPKHSILAEEHGIRLELVNNSISHIEENLSFMDADLLSKIKSKYEIRFNRLQSTTLPTNYFHKQLDSKSSEEIQEKIAENIFNQFVKSQIDLIDIERNHLKKLHKKGNTNEEVLRKLEKELDLEEARLRMELYED
jgi:CPA1 family monovalent cation:H+ antiporter